jgi:hypothetical protein
MEKYKYTYQDWQEDQISPKELDRLRSKGELCPIDYKRIRDEQETIANEVIEERLSHDITYFLKVYSKTFTKEAFLESHISELQKEIDEIKARYPNVYRQVLWGIDGRYEFTYQHIAYINYQKERVWKEYPQLETEFEQHLEINNILRNFHRFKYIEPTYDEIDNFGITAAIRFLQWLKWFQKHETKINEEIHTQFLKSAKNGTKRDVLDKNNKIEYITWPQLFIDLNQADNILKLIDEHLSSTGEWLTYPKSRYLVALCMELENKGYFRNHNTITNPLKAIAFRIQFGEISPKNFQPEERNKAEDFRIHFKHIPYFKPETIS